MEGLAITPANNVYNDIILTCSVVVTDLDETLTPTYEWSIGSMVVGSGSQLDLSSVTVVPGESVTCSASVTDGDGASASDSTNTTIDNRLPVVDSISIAPNLVYTNEIITATVSLSDDDAQAVTPNYEWYVVDLMGVGSMVQMALIIPQMGHYISSEMRKSMWSLLPMTDYRCLDDIQ